MTHVKTISTTYYLIGSFKWWLSINSSQRVQCITIIKAACVTRVLYLASRHYARGILEKKNWKKENRKERKLVLPAKLNASLFS